MLKNPKLWVLGVLVSLGGTFLSCDVEPDTSATFEGTWYGYYMNSPLRIDLHYEGEQLAGSANMILPGGSNLALLVSNAEVADGTLRLKLSGLGSQGMGEFTDHIDIELRIPKAALVGSYSFGEGIQSHTLMMSRDEPEWAARFAGIEELSQEEIIEGTAQAKNAQLRADCANHLKQLGLVMKMFANESRGERFPSPDRLSLLKEDVYPEYLSDTTVLMCPADDATPEEGMSEEEQAQWYFDNSRFWYIGHALNDEEQGLAYLEACRKVIEEGDGNLDIDLDTPNRSPDKIYRTREGIERFLITDINRPGGAAITQSTIPVLVERPGTHEPEGGNVLFMDGHGEYIRYPGKFPMTEAFIEGLIALDELP